MKGTSPFIKYSVLFLGALFLLCTFFLVLKLGSQLYWQHVKKNLLITEGLIERVSLVKAQPIGMGTGKVRPSDRWWLKVKYSYVVDGEIYSSERLNISNSAGGQELFSLRNEYENALRDKKEVAVYYYKFDPSMSVLIPDTDFGNLAAHFIVIIVFSLMTIGSLSLFRSFK